MVGSVPIAGVCQRLKIGDLARGTTWVMGEEECEVMVLSAAAAAADSGATALMEKPGQRTCITSFRMRWLDVTSSGDTSASLTSARWALRGGRGDDDDDEEEEE
jgi:hypothetical protein